MPAISDHRVAHTDVNNYTSIIHKSRSKHTTDLDMLHGVIKETAPIPDELVTLRPCARFVAMDADHGPLPDNA